MVQGIFLPTTAYQGSYTVKMVLSQHERICITIDSFENIAHALLKVFWGTGNSNGEFIKTVVPKQSNKCC